MITPRCSRSGPGANGTWAGPVPRSPAACTRCCASWYPAACPARSPQARPGRSWPRSHQQGRRRRPAASSPPKSPRICAASISGSARRERSSLRWSGPPALARPGCSGWPGHRRCGHRRRPRSCPAVASRDNFASYNGTAPIEVSSGGPEGLPAVPARQPPPQPRDPYGRGHPDPLPAHQGPRLLRQETGRRQNPQKALRALKRQVSDAIFACLQEDARRAAAAAGKSPGGQPGDHSATRAASNTPTTGSSGSYSRARHPPYDHRSLFRAAAIPCERGAGSRTGRSRPRSGARRASSRRPPASR